MSLSSRCSERRYVRKTRAVLSSGRRSGVVSRVRGVEPKVAWNWNFSSQENVAILKREACISGETSVGEEAEESEERERDENREGRGAKSSRRKRKEETAKSEASIAKLFRSK